MISLGQGIHLKAEVLDSTYVFVKIGLGFHAQYTLEEALQLAQQREAELQRTVDRHSAELSKIKAHITLMGVGLQALNTTN